MNLHDRLESMQRTTAKSLKKRQKARKGQAVAALPVLSADTREVVPGVSTSGPDQES
jgi:hypothetical protein